MPADLSVTAGCAERPAGTSEPRCPASAKKAIRHPAPDRTAVGHAAAIVRRRRKRCPSAGAWKRGCCAVMSPARATSSRWPTAQAMPFTLGHSGAALVFGVQVGGATTQVATVPAVFSNGTWVHVAASIDENGQLWLCKTARCRRLKSSLSPSFGGRSQAELGRTATGTLFSGIPRRGRASGRPRVPAR